MNNSFGQIYRFTTFGESHGTAIGGVIDGVPAGLAIDIAKIQQQLDRRRPGQSAIVSQRNEKDRVEILSGIFDGKTTGAPIGFIIRNNDCKPEDYDNLCDVYRPSHADYTYEMKYGLRDYRGGGRASARETSTRVVAGAIARQALEHFGITIYAYTSQIGNIKMNFPHHELDLNNIDSNDVRCPDVESADKMTKLINAVRDEGDSVGGVVSCVIKGAPIGLGEPVYGKLQARLAEAMLSINAAKGFEYGMGFDGCSLKGSEVNDRFYSNDGTIRTRTNYSGGIQGGISNGEDIYFSVAFKPVATLNQEIETVNKDGECVLLKAKGRHDPCVVARAVPVVEAIAACVILDALLLNRTSKLTL